MDEAAISATGDQRHTPRPTPGEAKLLRAAKCGSPDAIEALVRANWSDACRVAIGITGDAAGAEDIAQEALLSAIRALPGFNARRPFRPWLYAIVTNRALDHLRRRGRLRETSLPEEGGHAAPAGPAPGVPWISDEIRRALLALSPDVRAALILRHVLDFNSSEIATILGSSAGTVRSNLHRARIQVREQLESDRSGSEEGSEAIRS